jgi:diguanylate cyclase (GGDEF)-like protein
MDEEGDLAASGLPGTDPEREDTITQLYAEQCATEAIHLLGGVQPHGYLTVIDLRNDRICQVSAGITRHYPGLASADSLLGQPADNWIRPKDGPLRAVLDALKDDELSDLHLQRRLQGKEHDEGLWEPSAQIECSGYRTGHFAVLEWQPSLQDLDTVAERYRALTDFTQIISERFDFESIEDALHDAAQRLQAFSGYERVMVYRFLPDWSGDIVAEATARGTSQRFLGQRFPDSDIPPQARELYLRNRLRVLADVNAPADALIPEHLPEGETLDQSIGLLRSMSEAHLSYLKNMKVRATMTISIIIDGRLWGLLACHHSEALVPPNHVVQGMRSAARLLSRTISSRIEGLRKSTLDARASALEQHIRDFFTELASDAPFDMALQRHAPALSETLDAKGVGILTGGGLATSFELSATARLALKTWLRETIQSKHFSKLASWSRLPHDLRELDCLPGSTAGILVARLSEQNEDCIFWLRSELITEVHWAGKPGKFVIFDGADGVRLEPRRSFELWREEQRGSCEQWTATDEMLAESAAKRISELVHELTARRLRLSLNWSANHDGLTSLLNRNACLQEIQKRLDQGPLAIAIFDVDNFHHVNDTLGHEAGDLVLQEMATRLAASAIDGDIIGRVGGDEFAVARPIEDSNQSEEAIADLQRRLFALTDAPFSFDATELRCTLSIGIAIASEKGEIARNLLKQADIALLEASKSGIGESAVFAEHMGVNFRTRVQTEHDLSQAIKLQQFALFYQPQIDLKSGKVVGCEALLRWLHPERGLVMPNVFIPIAEETGLIRPIGAWVINESIRQLAEWNRSLSPDFFIAFNASFSQVRDASIVDDIKRALADHGANPLNLQIELTESAVMDDEEICSQVTSALSKLGVQIALDDFGTGYSSLSHIQRLKMDCIKIDRSFVIQLERDEQAKAVISSLLSLARTLNLQIVAEGVDNPKQLAWLKEARCDIGQGFLWSKAVSAAEFPHVARKLDPSIGS